MADKRGMSRFRRRDTRRRDRSGRLVGGHHHHDTGVQWMKRYYHHTERQYSRRLCRFLAEGREDVPRVRALLCARSELNYRGD